MRLKNGNTNRYIFYIILIVAFSLILGCNKADRLKQTAQREKIANYKLFNISDNTDPAIRYTSETDYVTEVIVACLEAKGYQATDNNAPAVLTIEIDVSQFNILNTTKTSIWTGGVTTVQRSVLVFDIVFRDKEGLLYSKRMSIGKGVSKKELVGIAVSATLKPVPNSTVK